jgi:hypothetical protein
VALYQHENAMVGTPADILPSGFLSLMVSDAAAPQGGTLLHRLPVAVYMVDADGRVIFSNEAADLMWGATPVDGERVDDLWRAVDINGEAVAFDDSPIATVLRTGQPVRGASGSAVRRDGSVVHYGCGPTPLVGPNGHIVGAIDVLVDLTAQRAAEARLRESEAHYLHAVELNPQMPWTADAEGNILHVNERWCRLKRHCVTDGRRLRRAKTYRRFCAR